MTGLTPEFPVLGWRQFISAKKEMLDAYDRAREKARSHEVETYHGKVAEAEFRRWLSSFLPKRYGVTSGYVISIGLGETERAPHYDVIIYDVLDAPVLWIEHDADSSQAGRSLAIPAEYVRAVIEVKSSLNAANVRDAIEHLNDLAPMMHGVDQADERYKLYLPADFFCALVFFEVRKSVEFSEATLAAVLNGQKLRGFLGGLVLRSEALDTGHTGRLKIGRADKPMASTIGKGRASLLRNGGFSASVPGDDDYHYTVFLMWFEHYFAEFAFDMVAIMQGTYQSGHLSSMHGLGASGFETLSSSASGTPNEETTN